MWVGPLSGEHRNKPNWKESLTPATGEAFNVPGGLSCGWRSDQGSRGQHVKWSLAPSDSLTSSECLCPTLCSCVLREVNAYAGRCILLLPSRLFHSLRGSRRSQQHRPTHKRRDPDERDDEHARADFQHGTGHDRVRRVELTRLVYSTHEAVSRGNW